MSTLAIHGGNKTITYSFKPYNSISIEELNAAETVIKSGILSKYLGTWSDEFYGGVYVNKFENYCKDYFKVKHAITVNSWTSGLIACVGAIGIEPGDEVIVTPWTMCASATAILHWNAIPVFADIETDTFNIDPKSVLKNISSRTRAIMAVDIFGHSCDVDSLMEIAEKYNLKLITDTAQSPGTYYKNKITGTLGHVGGFSLNYHKHIHTGESGIVVTNDDLIAERVRLIRNHAEAVLDKRNDFSLVNMIGHNFRLGEIECAIGIEQLKKLNQLLEDRQKKADFLTSILSDIDGLRLPLVKKDCTHAYYMYPIILDINKLNVSRKRIVEALKAEGIQGLSEGYTNIHLLPIYQKKIAYGTKGFPWKSDICSREVNYKKGICPNAEHLNDFSYIGFSICLFDLTFDDIKLIGTAFKKVWDNLEKLKE